MTATRCRCGRLASTEGPCQSCGNSWPMVHCHNPSHLDHHFTTVTWPDGEQQRAYWPIGSDGRDLPMMADQGAVVPDVTADLTSLHPDLLPCAHAHPHDGFTHPVQPYHELEEEQKV